MLPAIDIVSKQGSKSYDPISFLFNKKRTIIVSGEIDDKLATEVNLQLMCLGELGKEDITIYINSPGGSVSAGLSILDTMNMVKCDIRTICNGTAASMAAVLLSAGTKGKRYATTNAEMMIHQVIGGMHGQASDVQIAARHIEKTKQNLNVILAENTGNTLKRIQKDTDRDYYMTAVEAIKYGLIDNILV